MNDVLLFLPRDSFDQKKAQEKMLIEDIHSSVHILSIPGRLVQQAFDLLLQKGPYCEVLNKNFPKNLTLDCKKIETAYAEIGKEIEENIPNVVKELWNKAVNNIQEIQNTLIEKWLTEHNIPKEASNRFFESSGYSLSFLASFGTAKVFERLTKRLNNPPRICYSENYEADLINFASQKKIHGVLKKDRTIVRYHTEESIQNKSHKWWTTTKEANLNDTMEKIKERLALLDCFGGEKTHVTVAVIPKGTKVECYCGKAALQSFNGSIERGLKAESRSGGGFQIRLKSFDKTWIREIRDLNGKKITTNLMNPMKRSQHVSLITFPILNHINNTFFVNDTPFHLDSNTMGKFAENFLREKNFHANLLPMPSLNPQQDDLKNFSIEETAQRILDFAGDLTGINPAIRQGEQLKNLFISALSDPTNAPKLIFEQLCKEPKVIYQHVINAPKELCNSVEGFFNHPSLMGAAGIAQCSWSIVTLANEILPVMNKISREIIKNPSKLPLIIPKELVNLTFNKIKSVVQLSKEILHNPMQTGIGIAKSFIKTPKVFIQNIKSFCGLGRSKRKKQRRRMQQESERVAQENRKIAQENERIAQENERQRQLIETQIRQKITLAACLCFEAAMTHWMVPHDKSIEDYFSHLVMDWKKGYSSSEFLIFAEKIYQLLREGQFDEVHRMSPRTHTKEPIAPPEVAYAYEKLSEATRELKITVDRLENTMEKQKNVTEKEILVINSLTQTNQQLTNFLSQNEERLKNALKEKLLLLNKNK